MSDDNNRTTIIEAGSKGVASAAMPYVAIGVIGYVLYKKLGDEIPSFPDLSNIGGGITETVTNITENVSKTVKTTKETYYYGGEVVLDVPAGDVTIDGITSEIPGSTKYVKRDVKPGSLPGLPGGVYALESKYVTGKDAKESISIMPISVLDPEVLKGAVTPESKYTIDPSLPDRKRKTSGGIGSPTISTGIKPYTTGPTAYKAPTKKERKEAVYSKV